MAILSFHQKLEALAEDMELDLHLEERPCQLELSLDSGLIFSILYNRDNDVITLLCPLTNHEPDLQPLLLEYLMNANARWELTASGYFGLYGKSRKISFFNHRHNEPMSTEEFVSWLDQFARRGEAAREWIEALDSNGVNYELLGMVPPELSLGPIAEGMRPSNRI